MTMCTRFILFAIGTVIALAIMMLLLLMPADAAGCTPQPALNAADIALQSIRYGWPGQAAKVDRAITVAHRTKAPERFVSRLLLAKRYLKRYPDLSRYHLWMAVSHSCY